MVRDINILSLYFQAEQAKNKSAKLRCKFCLFWQDKRKKNTAHLDDVQMYGVFLRGWQIIGGS